MQLDNQEITIKDPQAFNSTDEPQSQRKLRNISRFGTQSMAYSSMQEGIKEFRHPSFKGFIAYSSAWGVDYVLSDPITPVDDHLKATLLFLEHHKNAVFCQISHAYALKLSYLKFVINGFGVENIVELTDFKVGWRKRKCLKSYLSKLEKQGYYVFEYKLDYKKIQEINEEWLKGKQNSKELRFMARPFKNIDESDVRYFYLIKENKIIGFCSFDPVFSFKNDGQIRSYSLQHLRVADEAPLGSQDFLILNALFQFKEEGFEEISLGLAPLYKRVNSCFKSSKLASGIFSLIYKTNIFYSFKTIGQHKDHYKARQDQTFVASRNQFTLKQLCGLLKINNLI